MNKKNLNRKIIGLVLQQKSVRIPLLLSLVLFVICIVLFSLSYSFSNKINVNNKQIQDIQAQVKALQLAANESQTEPINVVSQSQTLAPYTEIVPFISFLESLFAIIDKESKISIRDDEKQIRINRYTDYEVELRPGEKFELLLKALDGLYKSKYLTKITSFNINYTPTPDGKENKIADVDLVVRLYFE